MDQTLKAEKTNTLEFTGERQVAPDIAGIRRDHVERYRFASQFSEGAKVLDFGCGVGYGAKLLAEAGHSVTALDRSLDAILYAQTHYADDNVVFVGGDDQSLDEIAPDSADVVTAFEVIEHLPTPLMALRQLNRIAPRLVASVPNEAVFPFTGQMYHFRHYTKAQFQALLEAAGYRVTGWFGQRDMTSPVEDGVNGRTLVVTAERAHVQQEAVFDPTAHLGVPEHVALIGMGPTSIQYLNACKMDGGRHGYCDETWCINTISDIFECDRIFHGDDIRVQEARAERDPAGNIAKMVKWLGNKKVPIYTSRVPEGWRGSGLIEFPLEAVLNNFYRETGGVPYFNSTGAYAVAYAAHIGVKRLSIFGLDYTLADVRIAEAGRACVEFWLALGASRGMDIHVASNSTLFDAHAPYKSRLYGYDMCDVHIFHSGDGVAVRFSETENPPTAAEVEARYDHNKPIADQIGAKNNV